MVTRKELLLEQDEVIRQTAKDVKDIKDLLDAIYETKEAAKKVPIKKGKK